MTQTSLDITTAAQTPEQLYNGKIDLACVRIANRLTLRRDLAKVKAKNSSSRYQLEVNLGHEKLPEITSVEAGFPDPNLTTKQRALANFRKATLLHFLSNREEIIQQIRYEFMVTRSQPKPTINQILDFILPRGLLVYNNSLSSEDKVILYGEVSGPVQIANHLFQLAAIYPVEGERKVDLNILQDMDAFYGQLAGVLSGLGHDEWASGHEQEEQLKEELKNYPINQDNLPDASLMEPLAGELRVFLVTRSMRLQIQSLLHPETADNCDFELNLCLSLLDKYNPTIDAPQSAEALDKFGKLPSISEGIYKRILSVFSQTKEKFLQQFEQSNPTSQLIRKVYFALKLIADLGILHSGQSGADLQLNQELSAIFAKDLEQALSLIKVGTNSKAETILDGIISAGKVVVAKLLRKN